MQAIGLIHKEGVEGLVTKVGHLIVIEVMMSQSIAKAWVRRPWELMKMCITFVFSRRGHRRNADSETMKGMMKARSAWKRSKWTFYLWKDGSSSDLLKVENFRLSILSY